MNVYNNIEDMIMFNSSANRAYFHKRHRVRKKNYKRVRRMMLLSDINFRQYKRGYRAISKWKAKKICGQVKNREELF